MARETKEQKITRLTAGVAEMDRCIPIVDAGIALNPSEPLLSMLRDKCEKLRAVKAEMEIAIAEELK